MLIPQLAALAKDVPPALVGGRRQEARFDNVRIFCLFIGYPRSGHSLVGALLDAHPNILLAHEQHVLRYVRAGFNRTQIFFLLADNSRRYAAAAAANPRASYRVPGQWQGANDGELRVIGDKGAWGATLALARRPDLLDRLRRLSQAAVRVIHVVRNPYDTIARMVEREEIALDRASDHYFRLAATVATLKGRIPPADLLEFRHEDFVAAPQARLAAICSFLDVQAAPDYLAACAGIFFPAPRRSRHEAEWNDKQIVRVQQRCADFDFLAGYSFDD
jgi:hypothetical protein